MQVSQMAVADNLASAALLLMGESDESTPLVIARDVPAQFGRYSGRGDIAPADCLFKVFYQKTGLLR